MDGETQDQEQPIRTAADIAIEELTKRLDNLESLNRELREANAGLWAAAHPVPQAEPAIQAPSEPTKDAGDWVLDNLNVR